MYEIIYGDFPWSYTAFGTAALPYAHMPEQEIAAFDFAPFMAPRCVLFLWVTGPKMDLAFRCVEAWKTRFGLRYLGMPYIWVKTRLDGQPIGASGPRPTLVKPLGECVIALTNVKRGRPFPLLTEAQVQWVDDSETFLTAEILAPKARRGQHSRKPAQVRDRIVELLGDRPRIELFARQRVTGWAGHGNEYPHELGT
jgi:N6-adenosine-specific RNA methylase IME4